MIVSHRHRFVFFAIPKTATHSIREALRPHLGPDDWEQQVLKGQQFLPIQELADVGHGHISVRQLRPHLPDEAWNEYFKFGFVRNPFDRFVSACFFLNRGNSRFATQAQSFMKSALSRERFRRRVLVRPQADLLTATDESIGVDYVGRYESLQETFNEICDQIGIPTTELGKTNTSEHDRYREYYDDDLRSRVGELYRRDVELFDYSY